ncbi:hypothetical protein M1M30_gp170 [Maribacter phage Colly_1]|uniref:Uncharacterized protein n=1 Tax=Maribacter phage Colly_1 TaxID=2745691 RepID=A0A8E4UXX5_9CAUD|nr:hypothetical protein M1M30_gp170 [Maribacter phage Colly_1]QQO97274.1 hypothetical protein Colly1_170 [Maribacter phage Colly_1]
MSSNNPRVIVYKTLPADIKVLLNISQGWLVGSASTQLCAGETPKDYDIVVPSREKFQYAVDYLGSKTTDFLKINSYGGLKFTLPNDITIDIWCQELGDFLQNARSIDYIYNLSKNLMLENIN